MNADPPRLLHRTTSSCNLLISNSAFQFAVEGGSEKGDATLRGCDILLIRMGKGAR
jgi:hypothetical protein